MRSSWIGRGLAGIKASREVGRSALSEPHSGLQGGLDEAVPRMSPTKQEEAPSSLDHLEIQAACRTLDITDQMGISRVCETQAGSTAPDMSADTRLS